MIRRIIKDLNLYGGLIIALLAIALYANTIRNGFVYDDNIITNNYLVSGGIQSIPEIFKTTYRYGSWSGIMEDDLYRPLPITLFAITWQVFPGNPLPGHLINVILYAITGLFLFILLRKIFSNYHFLFPFIACILFVAHPVHTEVVANIKSVDEILSFLFIVLTLLFALRDAEDEKLIIKINNNSPKRILLLRPLVNIAAIPVCFFLALLSKESAVTMLVIVPLTLFFFKRISLKKIRSIAILLLIPTVSYFILRIKATSELLPSTQHLFIDNILANADGSSRLATAFYLLLRYVKLMIFPHPLVCDYSYKASLVVSWSNPLVIASFLFHVGLFGYAIKGLRNKRTISYAILFYLITISIYSNTLFLIGSHFAERFLYVPLLGFCIAVTVLLCKIFRVNYNDSVPTSGDFKQLKNQWGIIIGALVLLIPYSLKTIARNNAWKDEITLFSTDVKSSPESARLRAMHADIIMNEKVKKLTDSTEKAPWFELALAEYKRATEIYPKYADAYGQWGYACILKGDDECAVDNLIKAIDLKSRMESVYNNLGTIYYKIEEYKDALDLFKYAVDLNPRFIDGWYNMASAYKALKDYPNAINACQAALKFAPGDKEINRSLGELYLTTGDTITAQQYLDKL